MSVVETIQIGNPILRETANSVIDPTDPSVLAVITDLKDTMRAAGLVGLAAPQIGQPVRILVTEIRADNWRKLPPEPFTVYVNPEITFVSRETETSFEGCGSIAHSQLFGQVKRAKIVTIKYQDKTGVSHETKLSGLLARVAQHEIDHLNGVLFTDKANPKTFVDREWCLEHIRGK